VITLPAQPLQDEELEAAIKRAESGLAQHVVVCFLGVGIMSSATISNLIILERLLSGMDRQLVLCSLPPQIMEIFRRVGLQGLFVFAEDLCAARQWLEDHVCPCRW
jgi:anti-anti-sigma regulatory factor